MKRIPLRPWPIVGCRHSHFQRAQIRRPSGKTVGDVRQNHTAIHRSRSRLESEVGVLRLVELLQAGDVLRIESPNIHEDVVVDEDAIPILSSGLTVLCERRILARLKVLTQPGSQWIDRHCGGRRVPTKRNRCSRIGAKAVVVR